MDTLDLVSNSITVSGSNVTTFMSNVSVPYVVYSDALGRHNGYHQPVVSGALGPEAPETWLRRRVREVCEAVAA